MKIKGETASMLAQLYLHIHDDCITYENGVPVSCVELLNALHGTLIASLRFYQKWRADVECVGCRINPCNPRVTNEMINGAQHTLRWHVDDMMGGLTDGEVNDKFIEWFKPKCEY